MSPAWSLDRQDTPCAAAMRKSACGSARGCWRCKSRRYQPRIELIGGRDAPSADVPGHARTKLHARTRTASKLQVHQRAVRQGRAEARSRIVGCRRGALVAKAEGLRALVVTGE